MYRKMAEFEYYITKYDQSISTLSINLDCLVEQAFKDTWEIDRNLRAPVYTPILQNSMNDFSYDIFYFIGRVQELISDIVSYVKPEKLILAISGCVPLYRIEQKRRELYVKYGTNAILNQLTFPGTILSELFDRNLKEWIPKAQDGSCTTGRVNKYGEMVKSTDKTILPKDVYYYHYTMPGEATVKIIQALVSSEFNQLTGAHVIYSPNSEGNIDTRMIAGFLFNTVPKVLLAEKNYTRLFNVDDFILSLTISPKDYAVLLTVFYDSFLPKFTEKPITEVVSIFKSLLVNLWVDDDLNLENLQLLLSKIESNTTDYNKVFMPRGRVEDFMSIIGSPPIAEKWTTDDIEQMCSKFYTMADWCCNYLSLHSVDWNITYPYLYVPSTSDLYFHNINMSIVLGDGCDFHVFHQLLCVLDLRSKQFAPQSFKPILDQKSSISYLYPVNYQITEDGIPILPAVQMELVKETARPYMMQNSWDRYDMVTHWEFIPNDPKTISYLNSRMGNITRGPSPKT